MRTLMLIVSMVTVAGIVLSASEPREPAKRVAPAATRLDHSGRVAPGVALPMSARAPAPRASGAARKYRYLLADLGAIADRGRILALLEEREQLAPCMSLEGEPLPSAAAHAPRLAAIEAALRALLTPRAWDTYALYRDSDVEQFQLGEYGAGLSEYAPLDAARQRALLEARLRQKRAFSQLLDDTGISRPSLSPAERERALALIDQGLREYRENYLAEVAPLLDERQFTALASFEATEFREELERLQRIVNTR